MATEQTSGEGSPAYNACFSVLRAHKSKLRASSGSIAVLYSGRNSKGGGLWEDIERWQLGWEKSVGISAPIEMVTDALDRIGAKAIIKGKSWDLCSAMLEADHFKGDEQGDLWDFASAHWSQNNDHIFVWKGSKLLPNSILAAIELPIQLSKDLKLPSAVKARLVKALNQLNEPEAVFSDAELKKFEKTIRPLCKAIAERNKQLKSLKIKQISRVWN